MKSLKLTCSALQMCPNEYKGLAASTVPATPQQSSACCSTTEPFCCCCFMLQTAQGTKLDSVMEEHSFAGELEAQVVKPVQATLLGLQKDTVYWQRGLLASPTVSLQLTHSGALLSGTS